MGYEDEKLSKDEAINVASAQVRAERILRNAGVNEEGIRIFTSSPDIAQSVIDDPMVAVSAAQTYPSSAATQYAVAKQELGLGDLSMLQYQQYGGADALVAQQLKEKNYVVNPDTGAFEIDGVIVDPSQGINGVYFPPNSPDIAGSDAWLDKIQDNWNGKRVETWRKTLNKWGADISDKGGFDHEFLNALQMYHKYRYLNRGRVIPLGPAGGEDPVDVFGDSELRVMVRAQHERMYGDVPGLDPSDKEIEEWSSFVKRTARRLQVKKDMTPEQAATEASYRFQEKYADDPVAKDLQDSRVREEENTELRDSLLSIADFVSS